MLGKRSRPAIGKLAGVLRSGIVNTVTSPRGPLDCRALQSPREKRFNYYNQHEGGIGLGIVVALDTSSGNVGYKGEIIAKYAICNQFSSRSNPINVTTSNKNGKTIPNGAWTKQEEEIIEGLEEEFTYVTCHGPNKTTTKVYYSGGQYGHGHHHPTIGPKISNKISVFSISPAIFSDDCGSDSDFLSSCHLCRKALHGKDIYMYRGEKAFCSTDCRQKQMKIDERKENCRSNELSSSPYSQTSRGQIFSTGIVAV